MASQTTSSPCKNRKQATPTTMMMMTGTVTPIPIPEKLIDEEVGKVDAACMKIYVSVDKHACICICFVF